MTETEPETTHTNDDEDVLFGGEMLVNLNTASPYFTVERTHEDIQRELADGQLIHWTEAPDYLESDHIMTLAEAEDAGVCVNALFFQNINQWTLTELGTGGGITWYGRDRDQTVEVTPDGDEWVVERTELVEDDDYYSPVRKTFEITRISPDDLTAIDNVHPYAVGCAVDHMYEFNPYENWHDEAYVPCGEDYAPWIRMNFLDANEMGVEELSTGDRFVLPDGTGHTSDVLEFVNPGDSAPTRVRVFAHHEEKVVDTPNPIFQNLAGEIAAKVDTGYYEPAN